MLWSPLNSGLLAPVRESTGLRSYLRRTRGSAAFAPTDLTGLKIWLPADGTLWQDSGRTTPATANSDPVGAWDDASGLGNHATQATSGLRPLLKTSVLNGKPVIRFDGSDDTLVTPTIALNTTCTFFVVYYRRTGGAANQAVLGFNGTHYIHLQYGSTHVITESNVTSSMTDATWYIRSGKRSSGNATHYSNGSSVGTSSNSNDCSLGFISTYNGVGSPIDGDIAEVIVYDSALNDTDRGSVEAYLNSKYAIY